MSIVDKIENFGNPTANRPEPAIPNETEYKRLLAQIEEWQKNGSPAEQKAVNFALDIIPASLVNKTLSGIPIYMLPFPVEIKVTTLEETKTAMPTASIDQLVTATNDKLDMIFEVCYRVYSKIISDSLEKVSNTVKPIQKATKSTPEELDAFDKLLISYGLKEQPKPETVEPYVKGTGNPKIVTDSFLTVDDYTAKMIAEFEGNKRGKTK